MALPMQACLLMGSVIFLCIKDSIRPESVLEYMRRTAVEGVNVMGFTHFDENGKAVMVDVTAKSETVREATATGRILVNREVFQAIKAGTVGKGDVPGSSVQSGKGPQPKEMCSVWRRRPGSWGQNVHQT